MPEEAPAAPDALSRELARERIQMTKPLSLEPLALALAPLLLPTSRSARS